MAMYYQGSSEIHPADGLQTLYLMNPNYFDTQPNTPFFNQFVTIQPSHDPSHPSPISPHHPQDHIQAVRHTIYGNFVDHHHHQNQNQSAAFGNSNQPNTPQQITPRGGLSLSLTSDHRDLTISPKNCSSPSSGARNSNIIIGHSEYLKAAQELLEEVANVGDGLDGMKDKAKMIKASVIRTNNADEYAGDQINGNKNGGNIELTTAQRQEIQMKKAKLNSMLDEVEQRYKQYHHQMHLVVTSFEQIAGIGSAKCYTHLALKTILKQFRCLKNTISSQIKALNKTLGEDPQNSGKKIEGSRLKFVDHHLRQQRTLQQLGMMQNNAWRPQRGLPERAVSVLRAWLFEHFLHPYPKDSDKHMLAKQTGLTRSQVSNWFINARVRLWKPMVEDMYQEETKNQDTASENMTRPDNELINVSKPNPLHDNNNSNITTSIINHPNTLQSPSEISSSTLTTSQPGFARLITSLKAEKNPKKPRHENQDNSQSSILSVDKETKAGETSKGFDNFTFGENYSSMAAPNNTTPTGENYLSGFSMFNNDHQQIPTNFHGNNNFSLTLALPPSGTSQRVTHQHNFLSQRNFEFATTIEPIENHHVNGINNQTTSHPNIGNYQVLDFQNRKPFPAQFLPDHFVT